MKEEKLKQEKTEKKEERKPAEKPKKQEAVVRGADLGISTKHSIAICRFIRGKNIEKAREELEQVSKMKKAIPMKGEIPHRKGMGSGRYPVKSCKIFIKLLKSLAANSNINGLEEPYIHIAKADRASRPYRRFGSRRFKRSNVLLVAKEKPGKKKQKIEKKEEKKKVEEKSGEKK